MAGSRIYHPFTNSELTIGTHSRRLPYKQGSGNKRTTIQWRERSQLLSEIEFFALYWDPRVNPTPTCVYAGAAPGVHIPLLNQMFPSFTFHLYDANDFSIRETDKIRLFQQYFTDEVAQTYTGRNDILFVSNVQPVNSAAIRAEVFKEYGIVTFDASGAPVGDRDLIKKAQAEATSKKEEQVWTHMQWQQNWVLRMNPEPNSVAIAYGSKLV